MDNIKLNNHLLIPCIGFGTFPQKDELFVSVSEAIIDGYRLFDTSDNYNNEDFLGSAIKTHVIQNTTDNLIVISKFSQPFRTRILKQCFAESKEKLNNYLNIYLLHWPYPFLWKTQWRIMEDLYLSGKCQAIGVCNFEIDKLRALLKICRVKPAINQIERHPMFQQNDIVNYCKENGIQVMSYSPVARHNKELFNSKILKRIAEKYNKTVNQVILRWDIDTGTIPIPGSRSVEHIKENIDLFDFSLDKDELEQILSLESGKRIRFDPKTRFNWKEKIRFLFLRIIMCFR